MRPNAKFWRESATLIALAKNGHSKNGFNYNMSDYKILLQQRSDKSGFLPSTIVFPGGTTEDCDSSEDWYKHFQSFGMKTENFKYFQSKRALLPPILQGQDTIRRQVSLRVTAIRETFEELGVLICKHRGENPEVKHKYASYISEFDIKHWQNKVHTDPLEFLSLCQHLDCYPDIWSLFVWSNWLTPIGYASQRFDTLFFVAAFDKPPPVYAETSEVSEVRWESPEKVMSKYESKKLMLPPPQWYELSRFIHQKDLNRLIKFASERSSLGCDQIYPILLKPKKGKGSIAIFPGDELYPEYPNFYAQHEIHLENKTIEELQHSAEITHRMEMYDLYTINVQMKNYSPVQCQLSPLNGNLPELITYV